MVGRAVALLERAREHVELLRVGVDGVAAQVALARHRVDAVDACCWLGSGVRAYDTRLEVSKGRRGGREEWRESGRAHTAMARSNKKTLCFAEAATAQPARAHEDFATYALRHLEPP